MYHVLYHTSAGRGNTKMKPFAFSIPMEPVAKGRPRMTKSGHAFTPMKTRTAEGTIKYFAARAIGENRMPLFDGPVEVSVSFVFPRPTSVKRRLHSVKPDLDNLVKSMDALNGMTWVDDSQIQFLTAQKLYGETGLIKIKIWPLLSRADNEKPAKKGARDGKK